MKEIYTAPEMEIITFESEDIITNSPVIPATPALGGGD